MSNVIVAYTTGAGGKWQHIGSHRVADVAEYALANGFFSVRLADGREWDRVIGWRRVSPKTSLAHDAPPAIPGFTDEQMRYLKRLSDRINELERRNDGGKASLRKGIGSCSLKGLCIG